MVPFVVELPRFHIKGDLQLIPFGETLYQRDLVIE